MLDENLVKFNYSREHEFFLCQDIFLTSAIGLEITHFTQPYPVNKINYHKSILSFVYFIDR